MMRVLLVLAVVASGKCFPAVELSFGCIDLLSRCFCWVASHQGSFRKGEVSNHVLCFYMLF